MSTLYAYGKVKPKLQYYGLPLEKAVEILDWYVSNYDSDEFNEAGIFAMFFIRLKTEMEEDEFYTAYAGTYSIEFKGYTYGVDADALNEQKPWKDIMSQLEALRKMIKCKFGIE